MAYLSTVRFFPFQQDDIIDVPSLEFPMVFTLDDFGRYSYRVRKWKVEIEADWNVDFTKEVDGIPAPMLLNTTATINAEAIMEDLTRTTEIQLACAINTNVTRSSPVTAVGTADTTGRPPGVVFTEDVFITAQMQCLNLLSGDRYFRTVDDDYLPRFRFRVALDIPVSGFGLGLGLDSYLTEDAIIVDFDSPAKTFEAGFVDQETARVYDITYNSRNVAVSVTPYEFWEYDPEDGGGPVYETTTDNPPLRDPFSVQL